MVLLMSLLMIAQDRIDLPEIGLAELQHFALSQKGDLFVLNTENAKIYRFDIRGHLVLEISKKGEGPANLQSPTGITVNQGRIYITDREEPAVKVYDYSGKHLESIAFAHEGVCPVRVKDGWLYRHEPADRSLDSALYLTDNRGRKPKLLATYANTPRGIHAKQDQDGHVRMFYNPAEDHPLLAVSPDGKTAWFYTPGQRFLKIIDIERAEIKREVPIPCKPVKFDRGWGEEQVRQFGKGVVLAGRLTATKVDPVFPEWFPMITDLILDPHGGLWVVGHPDLEPPPDPIILTSDGGRGKSIYTLESVQRLIGVYHNRAFVLAFDHKFGRPFIIVCQPNQVNAMTQLYPETGLVRPSSN